MGALQLMNSKTKNETFKPSQLFRNTNSLKAISLLGVDIQKSASKSSTKVIPPQLDTTEMIQEFRASYLASKSIIELQLQKLSIEQLSENHLNKGWSILQCIQHLNESCRYYIPKIEIAIEQAIQNGKMPEKEFSPSVFDMLVVENVHPQRYKHIPSTPHFSINDAKALSGKAALEEFVSHQRALIKLLKKASHTSLQIQIPMHKKASWTISLGSCFKYICQHQKLHLLQIPHLSQAARF